MLALVKQKNGKYLFKAANSIPTEM